jgi:hypothetical protein
VAAYLLYVGGLCWLDLKILEQPSRIVWFLACAWGVHMGIGHYRRGQFADSRQLTFDERPAPAVLQLQLGD